MIGGYQIISLKNINLESGTPVTIPGVWDALEGNYRKPILLSGIQIANVEYPDCYVALVYNTDAYTAVLPFTIGGKAVTISIGADDATTITIAE